MNWTKQGQHALKTVKNGWNDFDGNDLLEWIGLQKRTSFWGSFFRELGVFCGGVCVGVGVGLLFAPKTGTELRSDVVEKIRGGAEKVTEAGQRYAQELRTHPPTI